MYDNIKYNDPVLAPISALFLGLTFLVFFFLLCKSLVLVSFNYVKNIRYIVLYVCFGADLMFYVCFEAMTPLPFLGAGGGGGLWSKVTVLFLFFC